MELTHDELLAKIDSKLEFCTCDGWNNNCWEDDNKPWVALRAVVELHKPFENITGVSSTAENRMQVLSKQLQCSHCTFGTGIFYYPCPTIKAIQKELE